MTGASQRGEGPLAGTVALITSFGVVALIGAGIAGALVPSAASPTFGLVMGFGATQFAVLPRPVRDGATPLALGATLMAPIGWGLVALPQMGWHGGAVALMAVAAVAAAGLIGAVLSRSPGVPAGAALAAAASLAAVSQLWRWGLVHDTDSVPQAVFYWVFASGALAVVATLCAGAAGLSVRSLPEAPADAQQARRLFAQALAYGGLAFASHGLAATLVW